MCVSYVRVWECSKPRCSTARSPNRAETQTTYRSNEGGNEKVIFTNFSQLYFHSVWLCVPSASLRATSATTCHAYTTKKAEKKREEKRATRRGERQQAGEWVLMWLEENKACQSSMLILPPVVGILTHQGGCGLRQWNPQPRCRFPPFSPQVCRQAAAANLC